MLDMKEGVDAKRLAFMVEVMGARIDKVHRIIKFKCAPFLATWVRVVLCREDGAQKAGALWRPTCSSS